jgi:SagB-type dehydrogenase family enzyme
VGRVRVRRSPHLVAYWRGPTLIACNYATGRKVDLPLKAWEVLNACGEWTPTAALAMAGFVPPKTFPALIDRMVALELLERSDRPRDPRAVAMDALAPWNPQVGFFHTTTRDVHFTPRAFNRRYMRAKAAKIPPPRPVKRYPSVKAIDLPRPQPDEFSAVLQARRTWRRYSSLPVTVEQLGTVLALAVGIQHWVETDIFDIPLKTSPSGGARHSIECYVVVRAVKGLKGGIYYYAPDRHALKRIRGPVSTARLRAYVPTSEYFTKASALVFFTTLFERLLWRYSYARAYRAALIESGHVCQTFCLSATRLGLASFSVMGLADSVIERDLGIDGITESVLYAAGVGRCPKGLSWAPVSRGKNPPIRRNPRVSP